jgi:predicted P-loop ATPase
MPDATGETGADWAEALMVTEKGTFAGNHHNAVLVLRHDLRLRGTIGINVRGQVPWCLRDSLAGPAGPWTDSHTTALTAFLQREQFPVGPEIVDRAVGLVGRETLVNPVGDWLQSLPWDRRRRLETMLPVYFGAEDTKLNRALGPMVMTAAAARGIDPGVQVDTVPIFEGGQGTLKTSAVRILGGPFGCESLPDFVSKDAVLVAGRYWIIEISELTAVLKGHLAQVNSFLTRRKDVYRPPYGHYVIEQPRGCFFIGTCNPLAIGYLRDPTGGRRFLPIEVGTIDLPGLMKDVGQLWAEAVVNYHDGVPFWPGPDLKELVEAQTDRYEGDVWEIPVLEAVEKLNGPFSIRDVIAQAFPEIYLHQVDRSAQVRIGQILSTRVPPLRRVRRTVGGTRVRFYERPAAEGGGKQGKDQG